MVKNATSYSGSGLRDWLVQRVSAVVIAIYVVFLVSFLMTKGELNYEQWQALFSHNVMKVATIVTLLFVMLHAWVGLWTVFTDYLKCTILRIFIEVLTIFALVSYFVWGVILVWSV